MNWTADKENELRQSWEIHGGNIRAVAKAMGLSHGSISGKSRMLALNFHPQGAKTSLRPDHPAVVEAHSLFPNRLRAPEPGMLKSGANQRKLGSVVTKGAWRGMPAYSLSLEERATCPRSCEAYLSCYGNGMSFALRYGHGRVLIPTLRTELTRLQRQHPGGFVVRLHVLGDFHSVPYVDFWADALDRYPGLRVFGYTAWQWTGPDRHPIGERVAAVRDWAWERFAIRTSGAKSGPRTLIVDSHEEAQRQGAIVCPAQWQQGRQCASCGLCWASAAKSRPVAFLRH